MACEFYIGESGTIIRADAGRDISDFTDLRMIFTKPDGSKITKSNAVGAKVTLGTIDVFDASLNETLLADNYAIYELEDGLFDVAGDQWTRQLWYDKDTVTPELHLPGRVAGFTVREV